MWRNWLAYQTVDLVVAGSSPVILAITRRRVAQETEQLFFLFRATVVSQRTLALSEFLKAWRAVLQFFRAHHPSRKVFRCDRGWFLKVLRR